MVNPEKVDNFQLMLANSMKWLKTSERKFGTIQIMSIGFNRFASATFESYLQDLVTNDIDTSQLHIFETRAKNLKIYTIVFGEYPDRRTASREIANLPEVLVADKPIPRTIGGILKEIEKIENGA